MERTQWPVRVSKFSCILLQLVPSLPQSSSGRRSMVFIALSLFGTAFVPPEGRTIYRGSFCPPEFQQDCGPSASCYQATSNQGFYEDLQLYTPEFEEGDHYHYQGEECGEGKWGATDAVDSGMAFHVTNWGTCNFGGGYHQYRTQYVFVDQSAPLSTWWHEGLSYYWGCQTGACHDDIFMDDFWETCAYE